jgi:calcineurin-like phosphoesterase family protein
MIWFTSDTHYYHRNIIAFCDRPYADVEAMNDGLISTWNSRVGRQDIVYHLGDFAFCGKTRRHEIIERLHGRKHLIRGNHDPDRDEWWLNNGFESVRDYFVLRVHDQGQSDEGDIVQYHQPIVLCHFPILSWENMQHGTWHLHGHCHGSLPPTRMQRMDVGVDTNKMHPYSYEEVKQIMIKRMIVPVDHHGT